MVLPHVPWPEGCPTIFREVATAYRQGHLHKAGTALIELESSLPQLTSQQRPVAQFWCGWWWHKLGRPGRAIRQWTELLDTAHQQHDRYLLALLYSNLACVSRECGDFRLAREYQRQALRLGEEFTAVDLLHLANDALKGDSAETAESLIRGALDLLDTDTAEDELLEADLLATYGLWCGLRGEWREAMGWLCAACRQHRAHGETVAWAHDLCNLAELCVVRGWLRQAQRFLKDAIRLYAQAGWGDQQGRAETRYRQVQSLERLFHQCAAYN
ncbi:MAG: hypothetical protein KatS3mg114_0561 [Planctomycetaceae bacterium]|nr:MAG: hypothetical protein KatS3mg114_0561 [Planctomycetaceae bacterium]